jgi:hypothetical protein
MHFKRLIFIIILAAFSISLISLTENEPLTSKPHTHHQSHGFKGGSELPKGYNDLFGGSGVCVSCHGSLISQGGQQLSITNDWRSTMMANAGKDPLWRAKVSHEVLVNPDLQEIIEDKCTKCHAPVGNKNAHFMGQEFYSIAEMKSDPLALDGVQCTVCHQITSESLGLFSGEFDIGKYQEIWGPYEDPFGNPMITHTGYTPVYSDHVNDSRLCASCHTLLTPTVDLNGIPTGEEFVEQAVYHEWENSMYPGNDISCQACHIPRTDDPVVISPMPPWLEARSPFGKHHFAGANVFMQKILEDNISLLGITAEANHFDSTIFRTYDLLQNFSLLMTLDEVNRTGETLTVDVSLQNLTGHKFPTGFPSRRLFIELLALNEDNDTVFHSGEMDEDFNLVNENSDYEEHYQVIESDDQVQIYEMVMADVSGDPTTVLLYAAEPLKDNRIPPVGFSTEYSNYDTVMIAGNAAADTDFNKNSGQEGSGSDIIHYSIPLNNYAGEVTVMARAWYQTMPGKWLLNMFEYTSDEIDLFKSLYEDAELQPTLVDEKSLISQSISVNQPYEDRRVLVWPNPTNGRIYINNENIEVQKFSIYSYNGRLLMERDVSVNNPIHWLNMPVEKGICFVQFKGNSLNTTIKIIVY